MIAAPAVSMRTLAELEAFVRDIYPRTAVDGTMLKVSLGAETVGLGLVDDSGQPALLVTIDICAEQVISAARAQELGRDIRPASLVLASGRHVMRQLMPLSEATAPFIRWTCAYVCQQAQRVRAAVARGAGAGGPYSHLAD